jgi:hypothetical protein
MTLLELAERCEVLGHADYQYTILADAAYAVFGDEADAHDKAAFWDRATRFVAMLRSKAFESAAMMLVPDDMAYVVHRFFAKPCSAEIYDGMRCVGEASAETPALALCAAALRARAA